ncbi:hypothetical protein CC80DRAFT_525343 [Byssothecium circinans]|uniref:Mediator of RNA polymerase II transcription subunit 9 n=1 Tax=Byssothecium circinans TaxID=147558 RepID=A0A6A5U0F4_9PLEO|nr:hypothetical protein CC80DRAFT_525343 [Byssothecium circinans]
MSAAATPHAPISATTSFPPTGSVTPGLPHQPQQPQPAPAEPGMPPPAVFDFIPDLYRILNRLIIVAGQPPTVPSTPGQPPTDPPLEIDEVTAATAEVKLKIQRASRLVLELPDIDRTCEDQEEEIAYLEARIAKLKDSLRRLGEPVPAASTLDRDGPRNSPDCMDMLYRVLGE